MHWSGTGLDFPDHWQRCRRLLAAHASEVSPPIPWAHPTLTNQSSTHRRHFSSSAALSPPRAAPLAACVAPSLLPPPKRLLKKPAFLLPLPPLLLLLLRPLPPCRPAASTSAASREMMALLSFTCSPSTSTTGTCGCRRQQEGGNLQPLLAHCMHAASVVGQAVCTHK